MAKAASLAQKRDAALAAIYETIVAVAAIRREDANQRITGLAAVDAEHIAHAMHALAQAAACLAALGEPTP